MPLRMCGLHKPGEWPFFLTMKSADKVIAGLLISWEKIGRKR